MLSPKTKRNISRVLPFGVIWFVSGFVFFIVETAAVGGLDQRPSTAIQIDLKIFIFGTLANTLLGLLIGVVEVLFLNRIFSNKSLSRKIVYKTVFYILVLVLITVIMYPIAVSMELNTNILDKKVWAKLSKFLISDTFLSNELQLAVQLGLSLFYTEISENIGHGVLVNFFTGKYHTPKEEKRIFMFLDMKSSTTIAEKLGHVKYFELLNEYYIDLSDAIIKNSGEIYQYVGDEVVVSWKYKKGIENNNCIKCFFAMKQDLGKRANWYEKNFGIIPGFKAGIHFGNVTTGEIGALKKEIIFTGDVLNATARIQELCNQYGVDLIISGDLMNNLAKDAEFNFQSLGKVELRGREENIELFTNE